MNFIADILKRFDYRLNFMTIAVFFAALGMYVFQGHFLPEYFKENGLMENLQLLVLAIAAVLAWHSKNNRKLFIFIAMVAVFMMIRETNMMRSWVCRWVYGPGRGCKWTDLGYYGYVFRTLRLVYVAFALWYFIKNKLWQPIWEYITKAPVFVWDLLILASAAFLATLAETSLWHNEIMEECFELVFYLAFVNCILSYRKVAL